MARMDRDRGSPPRLGEKKPKRLACLSSERAPRLGLQWPPWEKYSTTLLKAVFVEFVCVSTFIFISTGTVVFGCHSDDASNTPSTNGQVVQPEDCFLSSTRVLTIATAFGWTIAVMVFVSASFSGGHLNPAVTLAFLITKQLTAVRAVAYWAAQLCGAVMGSAFVYAVDRTGWHAAKGATNRLLAGISPASGWLLEALLTFMLVFVVLGATDASRAKISTHLPILAPLAIGLAVFISHLAAVAIDGCSINPARSFGPAVVSGIWTDQWIFWVGPMTGAALAAIMYEVMLRPSTTLLSPGSQSDEDNEAEAMERGGDGLAGGMGDNMHTETGALKDMPRTDMPAFAGIKGARVVDTSAMHVLMVPRGAD